MGDVLQIWDLDDTISPRNVSDYEFTDEWDMFLKELETKWVVLFTVILKKNQSFVAIVTNGGAGRIEYVLEKFFPRLNRLFQAFGELVSFISARSSYLRAIKEMIPPLTIDQELVATKQWAFAALLTRLKGRVKHIICIGDSWVELVAMFNLEQLILNFASHHAIKLTGSPESPTVLLKQGNDLSIFLLNETDSYLLYTNLSTCSIYNKSKNNNITTSTMHFNHHYGFDHKPSKSLNESKKKILFHCHSDINEQDQIFNSNSDDSDEETFKHYYQPSKSFYYLHLLWQGNNEFIITIIYDYLNE